MITRLDSISGVIISVLASSVVNHEANTLIITPLILSSLVIMIYHPRSQHTNNYTTNTVQPCNHDIPH
jgi:hypothetical protein